MILLLPTIIDSIWFIFQLRISKKRDVIELKIKYLIKKKVLVALCYFYVKFSLIWCIVKLLGLCCDNEVSLMKFKYKIDLNSSQKVRKLFLLNFLGKFCQLSFITLGSPCVYLSNDISSITIGYFRAKIRHFEYG